MEKTSGAGPSLNKPLHVFVHFRAISTIFFDWISIRESIDKAEARRLLLITSPGMRLGELSKRILQSSCRIWL